jgi:hypothetical protein
MRLENQDTFTALNLKVTYDNRMIKADPSSQSLSPKKFNLGNVSTDCSSEPVKEAEATNKRGKSLCGECRRRKRPVSLRSLALM